MKDKLEAEIKKLDLDCNNCRYSYDCTDCHINKEKDIVKTKLMMLEVMNLGMDLRQKQLQGNCDKSGDEVLQEYFDENF